MISTLTFTIQLISYSCSVFTVRQGQCKSSIGLVLSDLIDMDEFPSQCRVSSFLLHYTIVAIVDSLMAQDKALPITC